MSVTSLPCTNRELEDVLAHLRQAEIEKGLAFDKSIREKERLLEMEGKAQRQHHHQQHHVEKIAVREKGGPTANLSSELYLLSYF